MTNYKNYKEKERNFLRKLMNFFIKIFNIVYYNSKMKKRFKNAYKRVKQYKYYDGNGVLTNTVVNNIVVRVSNVGFNSDKIFEGLDTKHDDFKCEHVFMTELMDDPEVQKCKDGYISEKYKDTKNENIIHVHNYMYDTNYLFCGLVSQYSNCFFDAEMNKYEENDKLKGLISSFIRNDWNDEISPIINSNLDDIEKALHQWYIRIAEKIKQTAEENNIKLKQS